jgi:hypothetical protein
MNIWRWPVIIATVSMIGLLAGLIFDGLGDLLAWLALSPPVVLSVWHGWVKR